VRCVVVWIAWTAAGVVALLVLGITGYDLYGRLSRLRKAMAIASSDISPKLRAIIPEQGHGRHRAVPKQD
jgi:hypothetical protein